MNRSPLLLAQAPAKRPGQAPRQSARLGTTDVAFPFRTTFISVSEVQMPSASLMPFSDLVSFVRSNPGCVPLQKLGAAQGEGNVADILNGSTTKLETPVAHLDTPPYTITGVVTLPGALQACPVTVTFTVEQAGVRGISLVFTPAQGQSGMPGVAVPYAETVAGSLAARPEFQVRRLVVDCDLVDKANIARYEFTAAAVGSLPAVATGTVETRFPLPPSAGQPTRAAVTFGPLPSNAGMADAAAWSVSVGGSRPSIPDVLKGLRPSTVTVSWSDGFATTHLGVDGTLNLFQRECEVSCFFHRSVGGEGGTPSWELGGTITPHGTDVDFAFDYTDDGKRKVIALTADTTDPGTGEAPQLDGVKDIHDQPFMKLDTSLNLASGITLPEKFLPAKLSLTGMSVVYDLTASKVTALAAGISCAPDPGISFIPGLTLDTLDLWFLVGRASDGTWQYSAGAEALGHLGKAPTDDRTPPCFTATAQFPPGDLTLEILDPEVLKDFDATELKDIKDFAAHTSGSVVRLADLKATYSLSQKTYSLDVDLAANLTIGTDPAFTLTGISLSLSKTDSTQSTAVALEADARVGSSTITVAAAYEDGNWTIRGVLEADPAREWLRPQSPPPFLTHLLNALPDHIQFTAGRNAHGPTLELDCTGNLTILDQKSSYAMRFVEEAHGWSLDGDLIISHADPSRSPLYFTLDAGADPQHTRLSAQCTDTGGLTVADLIPSLPATLPLLPELALTQAGLTYDTDQGHALHLTTKLGDTTTTVAYAALNPSTRT